MPQNMRVNSSVRRAKQAKLSNEYMNAGTPAAVAGQRNAVAKQAAEEMRSEATQALNETLGVENIAEPQMSSESAQNAPQNAAEGGSIVAPIKTGKATVIQHPYTGAVPQNVQRSDKAAQVTEIKPEVLAEAQDTINEARQDGHFASTMKGFLQAVFRSNGGQRAVRLNNVQFDGEVYEAMVNSSIAGKLASDPNMTAEKLAVFEQLDEVLAEAKFVGSGEYSKGNENKARHLVRYDYFENDINVGGKPYVVAFDVAVHKDTNNLRTYKVIEEMSLQPMGATPGPQPGAAKGTSSFDNYNIPNGEEYVKAEEQNARREEDVTQLAAESEELAAARALCERLGVELRLTSLPEGTVGYYENGVITIDPDADAPVEQVFIHELTHHLEKSGGYAEYADFVLEDFRLEHGNQALRSYMAQIKEAYAELGVKLSDKGVESEVVAECTEELVNGGAVLERLCEQNAGLAKRIARWFKDMAVELRGTSAERKANNAARRFVKALQQMEQGATDGADAGGAGQRKIARATDGRKFVDVEEDILQGKDEKDIPRVLADVVQNKFAGKISVSGQDIYVNQQTRREWQFSRNARNLYGNDNAAYQDKVRVFNNADELLEVSRNYINEGLKHRRKDKFAGFARGNVDFRVGDNGYTADVVVGITDKGNAVLYDLVNIRDKKIVETSVTEKPQNAGHGRFEASTDTSVSPDEENVKGQRKISIKRKQMLKNAKQQQEQWDADERELRQMELADEIADAQEAAREKIDREGILKNKAYAGLDKAYAVKEFGDRAIELFNVRAEHIPIARSRIEEYAKRAVVLRQFAGDGDAAAYELGRFLYGIGGVYDDSKPGTSIKLVREMDKHKVFVPLNVRENIGDFNARKEDSYLRLRTKAAKGNENLPYDKSLARIDDVYDELQERYGMSLFPELDNQTARLQRMLKVREEVQPEFISWDEFAERFGVGEAEQVEVFEKLQLDLNKLVNEYAHTEEKIEKARAEGRADAKAYEAKRYAEAAETARLRCEGDSESGELSVDVPEDMALQMANARFIKDPAKGGDLSGRDLTGGIELVTRHNRALREWMKDQFVRPLDRAKASYSKMIQEEMGKINAYMKEHGFKKGSAESAAIQRFGEGVRQLRSDELVDFTQKDYDERMERLTKATEQVQDESLKESNRVLWEQIQHLQNPKEVAKAKKRLGQYLKDGKRPPDVGETVPYTLADLQREFPDRWQEIKEASEFCRGVYDRVFPQIERAYEQIYPNAAKKALEKVLNDIASKTGYAERMRTKAEADELAAARVELVMEENQRLLEKYEREGKNAAASRQRRMINSQKAAIKGLQRKAASRRENARRAEDMIIHLKEEYNEGTALRQKHIKYRQKYFHHYKESPGTLGQLWDIVHTPAEISSNLVGVSEFTKPNSRFHGFMEGRTGHMAYTEDAFGGLQRYMQEAATAIYIDPVIKDFRQKIAGMAAATEDTKNANATILWLTRVTDALAGKTKSLDRPMQEESNRKTMRVIKLLSGKMRASSVMYNLNTLLVQCGNWPNLQLMGVSAVNQGAALVDAAECWFGRSGARELLGHSDFMRERYLDDVINKMDYRANWRGKPQMVANWMLQFLDEQVARHIWFAAYRQGRADKAADPIAYADELTRKCVGGRGIGEMSLHQQTELVKLVAPFQLEVANTWNQMKETAFDSKIPLLRRMERFGLFFAQTWAMNLLLQLITGRKPLADMVDAIYDAVTGWDDDEEMKLWERSLRAAKRVGGELTSYMPAMSLVAAVLVPDEDNRKEIFGDNSATRFDPGNVLLEQVTGLMADAISGDDVIGNVAGLAASVFLPGAGQAKKTWGTLQDMGVAPRVTLGWRDGFNAGFEKGSYTGKGALRFDIDTDDKASVVQGLAFGRYATKEGRAYIEAGAKPALSKERTDKARLFEEVYGMGIGRYAEIYAAVKDLESDRERDALGRVQRDKDGNIKRVSAGSGAEAAGRGKSRSLKMKEAIDAMAPSLSIGARQRLYKDFGVAKSVW